MSILQRPIFRLSVLLVLLAALAVYLISGGNSSTNNANPNRPASPKTVLENAAALRAFEQITPPKGFHRYEDGPATTAPDAQGLACLPVAAICFARAKPLSPLRPAAARSLFRKFGVATSSLSCPSSSQQSSGPSACHGLGTFSHFRVGVILSDVQRVHRPGIKTGIQLMIYANTA